MRFDSSNDQYISWVNYTNTDVFVYSWWIYPTDLSKPDKVYRTLYYDTTDWWSDWVRQCVFLKDDWNVELWFRESGNSKWDFRQVTMDAGIVINKWQHIVFILDNIDWEWKWIVYVNWVKTWETSHSYVWFATHWTYDDYPRLCRLQDWDYKWEYMWNVCNVRLFDKLLTPKQIQELYYAEKWNFIN